ncbi:MAG: type IV pilin protein [Pseudomonadota bacterium]
MLSKILPGAGWQSRRGFTLVELMVALAILAVVAAVAVPLYTAYSERTYATEAQADLLNAAQALELFAAVNFSYEGSADTDGDGAGDADAGPLAGDIYTPRSADQGRYEFNIAAAAGTFTLTAVPQVGVMENTGNMTIDEAGNRRWDRNDDGDYADADEDSWESK